MIDALIEENQRLAAKVDSLNETIQELTAHLEAEKMLRYKAEYDLSVLQLDMLMLEKALMEIKARFDNFKSSVRS